MFWLNGLGSVETTRLGAPPWAVRYLPLTTSEPGAWIWPSALATPGTLRTCAISDAGSGPTWSCPLPLPNAGRRLRYTSVPRKLVPKMSEKALRIWSVMTNVPAIIAVPSTIAIMVRTVRSLWLSMLRSA